MVQVLGWYASLLAESVVPRHLFLNKTSALRRVQGVRTPQATCTNA